MVWWWVASAVLFLVVIPAVVVLGQRVVRKELVVKRHLDRIARTVGDTVDADGLRRLDMTRQHVGTLRRLTGEYADALRDQPAPARPRWQTMLPTWPRDSR